MLAPRLALVVLFAQAAGLPPETAVTPVKVADFGGYTEGIVFDSAGNAFVSLTRRAKVMVFAPDGPAKVWCEIAEPNGHRVLPDGTHLLAARGAVFHLSATGRMLDTLPRQVDSLALRSPNDLALDGNGGVYVTDPGATEDDRVARRGRVFYVDSAGRLRLVASDFCFPNGIAVRPDGRVLYVDDSCTSHVYAFDIERAGVLTGRRIFAALPDSGHAALDGMTFDAVGRLYVAHYGTGRVEVLDTAGRLLRRYRAGHPLASNVAFGGPRRDELFVTGAPEIESGPGVVHRLRLGVAGRGLALPAPSR